MGGARGGEGERSGDLITAKAMIKGFGETVVAHPARRTAIGHQVPSMRRYKHSVPARVVSPGTDRTIALGKRPIRPTSTAARRMEKVQVVSQFVRDHKGIGYREADLATQIRDPRLAATTTRSGMMPM